MAKQNEDFLQKDTGEHSTRIVAKEVVDPFDDFPHSTKEEVIHEMTTEVYEKEPLIQIKCELYLEQFLVNDRLKEIANLEVAAETADDGRIFKQEYYAKIEYLRNLVNLSQEKIYSLLKLIKTYGYPLK